MHPEKFSIVIIGGGFSGTMTLVQLLQQTKIPLSIILLHGKQQAARGRAYSVYSDTHVLNVMAGNMSAFPARPAHFTEWCDHKIVSASLNSSSLEKSYLPRKLYGDYLEDVLTQALHHIPESSQVQLIPSEAIDLITDDDKIFVKDAEGTLYNADRIVLATGNQLPADPLEEGHPFLQSSLYAADPWSVRSVTGLEEKEDVFILGTGLTMVDAFLGLRANGFKGKVIALSPKGFPMLPHRGHPPHREILEELSVPARLDELLPLFRKHVKMARAKGWSGESVVDALRPRTQELWQTLSVHDRSRFMSHLRHLWGLARHRLAPEQHDVVQEAIAQGKLRILAGRLLNAQENAGRALISFRLRSNQEILSVTSDRLINCTGPAGDIRKLKHPLFRNLLAAKKIMEDPLRLGLHTKVTGEIISPNSHLTGKFYAIGPLLRGTLWESTAVPELRVQAGQLAKHLLSL